MLKIITVEEMTQVEKVDDVLCNLCGQSCREENEPRNINGLLGIHETGGYGQAFPPDLEDWQIDICQYCFAWIISHCRLPPRRREYVIGLVGGGKSEDNLLETDAPDTVLSALLTGDPSALDEHWRKEYDRVMERDTMLAKHPNRRKETK